MFKRDSTREEQKRIMFIREKRIIEFCVAEKKKKT